MGLAIAGLQALDRHVGAQDLLDAAQVGTGLEQVGSGAVAEAVRAGIPGPSRLAQAPVHDPAGLRGSRRPPRTPRKTGGVPVTIEP